MNCSVQLDIRLYDSTVWVMLDQWRVKHWTVRTRGGVANEYLWMNYPVPALLAEMVEYVGSDYVGRQRLRRLAGVRASLGSCLKGIGRVPEIMTCIWWLNLND